MEYIVEFEGHDIVFTTQLSRIRELNTEDLGDEVSEKVIDIFKIFMLPKSESCG